ncbi:hypothetical protein ACOMHN_022595 [Nucella lapillus]
MAHRDQLMAHRDQLMAHRDQLMAHRDLLQDPFSSYFTHILFRSDHSLPYNLFSDDNQGYLTILSPTTFYLMITKAI